MGSSSEIVTRRASSEGGITNNSTAVAKHEDPHLEPQYWRVATTDFSLPALILFQSIMASNKATPRKRGRPANATPRRGLSAIFLSTVELLNDLANFCGIGSLEIKMPRRAAAGMEAPDGWFWLESPTYKCPKFSIEANLQELVDHGIMRCTYTMVTGNMARVRIYVLPDDVGRSMIRRDDLNLRKRLKVVMATVDGSTDSWEGGVLKGEPLLEPETGKLSLFLMFNSMESPRPNPESPWIRDENTKDLLQGVLAPGNSVSGMRTTLYKYQKRTVALMLQKELAPERTQDPRLKEMQAPTGEIYYWDSETTEIFQEPRYYEDVRGGILAEEMGTGYSPICFLLHGDFVPLTLLVKHLSVSP